MIRRAKAMAGETEAGIASAGEAQKTSNKIVETLDAVEQIHQAAKTINTGTKIAVESSSWFWNGFLKPTIEFCKKLVKPYIAAWKKTDHKAYDHKFKKLCALAGRGVLLLVTFAIGAQFVPATLGGDAARELVDVTVSEPAYDVGRMAVSFKKDATFYLNGRSFMKDGATYAEGCLDAACEKPMTFEVKSSLVHRFWNVADKGSFFYKADDILNSVIPGQNQCKGDWYGWRRAWTQDLQVYPVLLSAKCTAITPGFNGGAAKTPVAAPVTPAANVQAPVPVLAPASAVG